MDSNSVVVSWENPDPKQCEGCPLLRGALLSERNAKIMCSQQRFLNHSEVKGREVKLRFTLGSTGGANTLKFLISRFKERAHCAMNKTNIDDLPGEVWPNTAQ